MEINQIIAQLAGLTGYLNTSTDKDEKNVERLQELIAKAILNQDPTTIRSKEFIFERSDLFLPSNMESSRLKKINDLASLVGKGDESTKTNVFVRNVPIRSTQITGSITAASAGVRVKTIGPVFDNLRKPIWFDLVNVKKLIAI